ncbi:hypothetical protein D3C71_2223370 [compost metagenome]
MQSTPVHALDHALDQAAPFKALGSASSDVERISCASLNEVTSMAYSGSRKKTAASASTA